MRVFVTGAAGFVGSYLVSELTAAGHRVVGLSRSAAGAEALKRAGAEVALGDVNDLNALRAVAEKADGIIHAAFNHDFANLKQHSEADRKVVETLGKALEGSNRPLIVTSGTGLVKPPFDRSVIEADDPPPSSEVARAATEEAAEALNARGVHVMLMRLPQVHDTRHHGRISLHIQLALKHGQAAYVGEGANRVPAAHVTDVVRLYRMLLEHGEAGARYHAVDEGGVSLHQIAEAIGARLGLPVNSISQNEAEQYFGGLAALAMADLAASGALTQEKIGWTPHGMSLISDIRNLNVDTYRL